jgi:hypothetical protein
MGVFLTGVVEVGLPQYVGTKATLGWTGRLNRGTLESLSNVRWFSTRMDQCFATVSNLVVLAHLLAHL